MTTDRVMLLIDADNISVDVMDQAVRLLMKQHGALHVRRAYCTAESAVKHQAVFKRLGIKPMVNLAAGKNSTDIALAVDAIDLVLAERPDVVAIASSDSDFAPLVHRLREKGCVVRGIGQQGKTGNETQEVYDDFTVLEHRKSPEAADKPARKTAARKTPAAKKAAALPAKKAARKTPAKTSSQAIDEAPRKTRSKTASAKAAAMADAVLEVVAAPSSPPARAPAPAPAPAPATTPQHETARKILESMPELGRGEQMELRVASQRLREAGLLSRSGASTKLLGQFPELFELLPPGQPNHLRLRR